MLGCHQKSGGRETMRAGRWAGEQQSEGVNKGEAGGERLNYEGGRTHTEHTFGKAQLEICDKTGREEGIGVGCGGPTRCGG